MGVLVNLAEWKKDRDAAGLAKDAEEIAKLRADVKRLMEDMGEPEVGPYMATEEENEWMQRMTEFMLKTLDGYSHWPEDSSDL
jgi:hypothetical protein